METSATFLERTDAAFSQQAGTLVSRLAPLLHRPLLIGGAAVAASLFFSGLVARAVPSSEVKAHHAAPLPAAAPQPAAPRHGEVPPLFLAILGLAALALSQTRQPERPATNRDDSCAGKKIARGQKLPKIRRPQPLLAPLNSDSGVIARKHHDDVMGFQPIGRIGMLHK
jgi:hypothetical protein